MPHGTIRLKVLEVGRDVQRKAVARDPAADANADGGDLFFAAFRPHPHARQPRHAPASMPNRRRATISTSSRSRTYTMHVAAVRLQVEDRIADQLSRPVIGDVAAAAGLEHRDAFALRACPSTR